VRDLDARARQKVQAVLRRAGRTAETAITVVGLHLKAGLSTFGRFTALKSRNSMFLMYLNPGRKERLLMVEQAIVDVFAREERRRSLAGALLASS
jgi:hypothetical protein